MTHSWTLKVSTIEFARLNRELMNYFRRRVAYSSPRDLAADTWLSIVRWYRGRCSLRAFAFLVASKQIIHARRRRDRRRDRHEPLSTPGIGLDERVGDWAYTDDWGDPLTIADEGPGPYSMLRLLANHAAIERALEQVGDDGYREVVRRWLDGSDNVQIAAELGIPYNTVRSRLGRGRAQVLAALRAEFGLE
jgi:RNA polymerase sigma factor (sigma-70 family)